MALQKMDEFRPQCKDTNKSWDCQIFTLFFAF